MWKACTSIGTVVNTNFSGSHAIPKSPPQYLILKVALPYEGMAFGDSIEEEITNTNHEGNIAAAAIKVHMLRPIGKQCENTGWLLKLCQDVDFP